MIKVLKSIQEVGQHNLPFLAYAPESREIFDISVRIHDEKWPTLRYRVKLYGKEVRVKQFFLDWFFPGFPKSLLKDFSSGFSTIRSREVGSFTLFLGRNYRKRDSACAWIHGTMVEMDSANAVSDDEYETLLVDMLSSQPDPGRLEHYQFPDRSHFAKGYTGEWYEDQRIMRLTWRRTGEFFLDIRGRKFISSGMGYADVKGKSHAIYVFQEGSYSRAIWIELTSQGIDLAHAVYDVRKGEGLFDTELQLADQKGLLVFRKPAGPAVLKMNLEKLWLTAGFSPGVDLQDLSAFMNGLQDIMKAIAAINEATPHRDANL